MLYFKHTDLVNDYHVSLKTVHNWIDAAKQGKVPLRLQTIKNRTYIANTPENVVALKQLSVKGKKYRNVQHQKVIRPKPEFYEVYDRRQILDIITSLNVRREVPSQYNYLSDGASNWDDWLKRLADEQTPNGLRGTVELLRANMDAIDRLLEGYTKVNLIDLGAGNAYPIKELLGHLVDKGVLHRYVAVDISPSMLAIAEQNVKKWHGDKIKFEGYVRDMIHVRFDDLLVEDMLSADADQTMNIALLFGGTTSNFHSFGDVFRTVYNSMGSNDLLMYTSKRDTEESRRYFDFGVTPGVGALSPIDQYILDLLSIDSSLYDAEMGFEPDRRMRYIRVRLNTAITIDFSLGGIERTVDLEKGDTILLLRIWHKTAPELVADFDRIGFDLLQSSTTKDKQYMLTIAGVKADSDTGV